MTEGERERKIANRGEKREVENKKYCECECVCANERERDKLSFSLAPSPSLFSSVVELQSLWG